MNKITIFMIICCIVLSANADLVQHWKLDDPCGTFVPAYGYTAMPIVNEITGGSQASIFAVEEQQDEIFFEQPGAISTTGYSMILNGRHDAIELGNIAPGTNPFTIAFWFNTNGVNAYNDETDHILSSNRGQPGRWALVLIGTAGQTEDITLSLFHDGGAIIDFNDIIDAGQWYHFAMTRSSNASDNFKIYLDGVEIAVLTDTTAFTCKEDAGGAIRMGNKLANNGYGATRGYNGSFDDVRIYDNALTATEVAALSYEPVVITSHPNDVLAAVGDTVGFSVSAQGTLPIDVNWYKSLDDSTSTPGDDSIAGTGQNLSISNVQVSHEGYYFCVVSNIDGSAVSDTATLGVKRLMAHWSLDNDAEGWDGSYYLDESTEDPCDHDADPNGTVTFVTGQKDDGIDMSTGWATAGTWNPSEFSGQLTVSFWLNWGGTNGTWQNFVTKRTGSWSAANALWQVCTDNDGNDLWFQSPHSNIQVADALVVGQWQHVVATFDGETGALYVNGEIANGESFEFGDESAETTMLTLGNIVEGTFPGNGKLDDVKVYNYAISDLDVALIYTTDAPGKTACVESYRSEYDFNNDCIVSLQDLAYVVAVWLDCGIFPDCLQ